jgi:hypothetical protein
MLKIIKVNIYEFSEIQTYIHLKATNNATFNNIEVLLAFIIIIL